MTLKRFYTILSAMILINLLYGPLVRATDSGLACPDWPLCHGKFVPEFTFQIFMEVGHRYYSGILGILVGIGFIWILRKKETRKNLGIPATLSLVFLISQVILGGLTVTKLLHPTTVNLHLLNAVLLLSCCLTVRLLISEDNQSKFQWNRPGKYFFLFVLIVVLYQLFLGGKVSSHYAGLVCSDFPTCNGEWFPKMIGPIRFQMEHRLFGYLAALSVLSLSAYGILYLKDSLVKKTLKIAAYLISFQIFLGAMNVLYQLPKLITGLHTLNGVLVFMFCFIAAFYHFRSPERGVQ
ncbi:COX15/CtaA family protein [Leptospira bandrabouensis]|uniref:COX15/CtaA family protein n=1 Tax=Leptospira bandrabouensis TaxID=2484903 RepID=UPI00223D6B83|nr:COX15/CtaA family protein [Leptospira bandrabouensis]MCW7458449.1 COX15/CtaA family protein [Leptospira bandrabouensis]MCW7478804.1 COX15/CtaA family protein [Leptospira bandrabouensis]MCW7486532.1 COX15/CtaA family protein [Leptospira bandrabouensis]